MPERPQEQTNVFVTQTQEGCFSGCGTGCGTILIIILLFWPVGMIGNVMSGQASPWWIPVAIVGGLVELAVIVYFLDQRFGWGLAEGLGVPEDDAVNLEERGAAREGAPAARDIYEQIRRLAQLRNEGHITPEEFEAKKRDLLDRL